MDKSSWTSVAHRFLLDPASRTRRSPRTSMIVVVKVEWQDVFSWDAHPT
jgi:hypothetical protein